MQFKQFKRWRSRKYGNKSARCLNKNHAIHQSMYEADICNELFLQLQAKQILGYEAQVKIPLYVNDIFITSYICDFKVKHICGKIEWVEAKGFVTDIYKLKERLFYAAYLKEKPKEYHTVKKYSDRLSKVWKSYPTRYQRKKT